jgi:hypothetical protein
MKKQGNDTESRLTFITIIKWETMSELKMWSNNEIYTYCTLYYILK